MEVNEYDRMARVEDVHWWWRARREIIAASIRRYAPLDTGKTKAIVEVGCGTGGNLSTLAQFGDVVGAEQSPAAIEHLRRKHGERFRIIEHAIPQELPGKFDVLAMLDVLEHLDDDVAALQWAAAQLVPGGIAVITVPAFQFLWSDLDEAVHHRRRYELQTIAALIPGTFRLLHLTYFNSLLFPLIAGVRLGLRLLPRQLRPAGAQLNVPPGPLNLLLGELFRAERHVVPRVRVPFGVSALAVLQRRHDSR